MIIAAINNGNGDDDGKDCDDITKAVFMFRTWRQNLPTNDFTCPPDFIWAHTVRWHKYKSPASQMTIQSYTNSIGSMGWDIFTLFTFET